MGKGLSRNHHSGRGDEGNAIMATYLYKAKKGPTEIFEGQIEALSKDDAVDKLIAMGLVAVSVIEKQMGQETAIASPGSSSVIASPEGAKPASPAGGQSQREIVLPPAFTPNLYDSGLPAMTTGIKIKDINIFTLQLSSLIKAGVPVLRALMLISQQTESKALAKLTAGLERQIKDGRMLSEAMASYPRVYNNLYINMVKAGEKSGTLDEVLQNLAEYRQKEDDIRQKLQAALAYPLLVVIAGVATIFIMLTFFLPKLIGLFEGMKQALPFSTRLLIGISRFTTGNWHWILIFLFLLAAVFTRAKEGGKKKLLFDFLKLRLPFIRKFVMEAEIARLSRTLALLLKNGVSVCEGLGLATDVLDNGRLKSELKNAKDKVINQGCRLSESLKIIEAFPIFAVNMVAVGEEGGRLEQSLNTIADLYERQSEQAIKIITSLLEPLLILIIGSIVGFIVFAMLTPVFNIGTTVR